MKNNRLYITYNSQLNIKKKFESMKCNSFERAVEIVSSKYNRLIKNINEAFYINNKGERTKIQ